MATAGQALGGQPMVSVPLELIVSTGKQDPDN